MKTVSPQEIDPRVLAETINLLAKGGSNAIGSVTITASAATTVVTSPVVRSNSRILLMPKTANAAAAIPTTYVSARANGSFTLTHDNNAQTDRHFDWVAVGG